MSIHDFCRGVGKQRRHVAVLAHAEKNQIQNRLAGLRPSGANLAKFRFGSFARQLRRRIFAANAMNLVFRDFQRREQKLVGHFEIAFRIIRRNTTLVRPEKMDVARKGRRAAVPNFSHLGLFNDRSEKLLVMRPPDSATQCGLPARLADSISSSHAPATREASSSAVAKEISSNFSQII